jgi:pimeloyl-ACP methyl ester carboxylesterase
MDEHLPRRGEPSLTPSSYLNIDSITMRYKTAGAGEQVILLHGWGGSIESLGAVFADLATQYQVFAIDFPGHGESGLPPTAWGVSDYAESVLHLMDALDLQRPHILAHSHGGRVTLKLASTYPDRVGKLILVNSAGVRPPQPLTYYGRVLLAKLGKALAWYGGRWGNTVRNHIYRAVASSDYANAGPLRETFVKLVREDLTPLLPSVKAPTLLIWGADDKDTPVSCARVMERLIPNAQLVILQNAGHFSYLDQYGKFRLIVGRFLRDDRVNSQVGVCV